MYQCFKHARSAACTALIDSGINTLPVDLRKISRHYGIKMVSYSHCSFFHFLHPDVVSSDGFITQIDDIKVIFVNDLEDNDRRRFTIGHELGHALLNHPCDVIHTRHDEDDNPGEPMEMQANLFSRSVIAPACVLHTIGVTDPPGIMRVCDISLASAAILSKRLEVFRRRGRMLYNLQEKQLLNQFAGYIEDYKKNNRPGTEMAPNR